jgi:hypothetical protein
MYCTRINQLAAFEVPHYYEQIRARKEYFDMLTGEDVWIYLVERDFQKRFFQEWADKEKKTFCSMCDAGLECGVNQALRSKHECQG